MHNTRSFRLVTMIAFVVLTFGLLAAAIARQWQLIRRSPLATPSKAYLTEACEWPCTAPPETDQPAAVSPTETPTPTETATPVIQCTPPPCDLSAGEVYFCPDVCPGGCGTTCATATPQPLCTPPLCAIGTSEVYFCAEACPGGCGTTCATYTPTAEN